MATVKIETYRGFDITFDTETERFAATIDDSSWEGRKQKQSLSAARNGIDVYIKDNERFEPFAIVSNPDEYNSDRGKFMVVGIRKDMALVAVDGKNKQFQISKYDEKRWVLYVDGYDAMCGRVALLEAEIDQLHKQIKKERKSLKLTTLEEWKQKKFLLTINQ